MDGEVGILTVVNMARRGRTVRSRPQLGVYVATVKAGGRIPPRQEKEHGTLSGNNIPLRRLQLEHS